MRPVPKTRYAKSGELNIAYQVVGDGPIDLLFAPGFISHLEYSWEMPFWAHILNRLSSFARLIVFDKRGTGLSDRVGHLPSIDDRMDDIRAVLDAVGSEHTALLGISEGGPMSLVFAATYPERTTALALRGVTPRSVQGPDWPYGVSAEGAHPIMENVERSWGDGTVLPFFVHGLPQDETTARFERFCASPGAARALLEMNLQIDVRHVLSSISAPTLVVHRTGDPICPVEGGRYIAEHVPGAKLVELPGDFHISGEPDGEDDALDLIEEFLTGTRQDREIDRVLATVLFTDIVGSTERVSTMGDRAWRRLLDAHEDASRREIGRFRGREIKSLGDGFLAAFDGPARAIRCATAIAEHSRGLGVEVRCGLHSGECEVRGDDLAGVAVHIGARIGSLAGPSEVLVSSTVKDLVAGSGIEFDERGEHPLKGVPGTWKLFAVRA